MTAVEEELKSATTKITELTRTMREKDADYENRLSDMLQQNEEKVLFFLRNPGSRQCTVGQNSPESGRKY